MSAVDEDDDKNLAAVDKNNEQKSIGVDERKCVDTKIPKKSQRLLRHDKITSKKQKALINYEKSWDEYVKFMNTNIPKRKKLP